MIELIFSEINYCVLNDALRRPKQGCNYRKLPEIQNFSWNQRSELSSIFPSSHRKPELNNFIINADISHFLR